MFMNYVHMLLGNVFLGSTWAVSQHRSSGRRVSLFLHKLFFLFFLSYSLISWCVYFFSICICTKVTKQKIWPWPTSFVKRNNNLSFAWTNVMIFQSNYIRRKRGFIFCPHLIGSSKWTFWTSLIKLFESVHWSA